MNRLDKIEAAMRYVYAHFLCEGDELSEMLQSRKMYIVSWRHIVRERIYMRIPVTLKQVGIVEGRISGTVTDHSTIWHSIKMVRQGDLDRKAIGVVNNLLDEFEEYWTGFGSPVLKDRIQFFNGLPRHILATVMALATEYGYADREKIDGLIREFKTQPKSFIKKVEQL